jgi:hypothetical protein
MSRSEPVATPRPVPSSNGTPVPGGGDDTWTYAALTLAQPGWPGTAKAEWVAATGHSEEFRTPHLLAAMDRLGAQGWELVTFAPAWDDRSPSFYFKMRRPRG